MRHDRAPILVTINVTDFWRRLPADRRLMIDCFPVPVSRVEVIPPLLRGLFATPPFHTTRCRLGTIARITPRQVRYYTMAGRTIHRINWSKSSGR